MADTFADLRDDSNPFNTAGISDEDRAILQYLRDAKAATRVDVVVTSTTDHPPGTTRHLRRGTNGIGLALDCRNRTRGDRPGLHLSVFALFEPVEHLLFELIYSGAPYSIKAGKRVPRYAVTTHWDHVHVAVDLGVFLRYPPITPGDDMPKPTDFTSSCLADGGGYFVQTAEGGVDGHDGAFVSRDGVKRTYKDHAVQLGPRTFLAIISNGVGGFLQIATDGTRWNSKDWT
jgi:hypothetical protein